MATVTNPKTKEIYELEDDIDVKTGVNKSVENALKQGYQQVYKVANPKTGETFNVEDLKSALKQGYMVSEEYEGRQDATKRYKDSSTTGEAASRGWFDGYSQGTDDEIVAGVKAVGNKIATLGKSDLGKDYTSERDEMRENKKLLAEASPTAYGLSKIGGGITGGATLGGAVTKIPGVATSLKVGSNALAGALGNSVVGTGVNAAIKLGAAGAAQSAVAGFGEAEGDVAEQMSQIEDAAKTGAMYGVGIGAGANVAKRALSGMSKIPGKVVDAYEGHFDKRAAKKITDADKKAGQFLQDPNKVESVRMYPEDKLDADEVIAGYKERLPEVYRDIAKDIKGLKKEAQKSVDKAYSKMAEETAKDTRPADPENNTLQAILKKIDDALEDNQNAPTPLDELALQRLEKIKTDTERLIGKGKLENVTDELGNEFPSYRPWTQGEILEHANGVARDLKSFSYRDQNMAKTYPLRQFSKDITNDLHTNAYGDLSDDAVKALREADGLYAQYATAQKELKPVTSKAFDKVTGAKLKTLDDQVENIPEIGGALDRLSTVAGGKGGMSDFMSPAMKEVKAREAVQQELLRRTKEKTVFDNLKPEQPGPLRSIGKKIPGLKYLINEATPQDKIRAVHSAQQDVKSFRKQLSKLDQLEVIKVMHGENPTKAGYLKYLIEAPRAITRGVIQSVARQSGVSEKEIEKDLQNLGVDVPQ